MKEQKKQTKILIGWVFAWVVSTAILSAGVNNLWDNVLITKIGLFINLAIGVGMIIANKNLFKHYDELQKKIHYLQWQPYYQLFDLRLEHHSY